MTATSQRRSRERGGSTSPTPLRSSQNACGEVRSILLISGPTDSLVEWESNSLMSTEPASAHRETQQNGWPLHQPRDSRLRSMPEAASGEEPPSSHEKFDPNPRRSVR